MEEPSKTKRMEGKKMTTFFFYKAKNVIVYTYLCKIIYKCGYV